MMSADALAQALAELAYQVYRGKRPPANVLRAFGAIVAAVGSKDNAVTPAKRAATPKKRRLNGHGAGEHKEQRQ